MSTEQGSGAPQPATGISSSDDGANARPPLPPAERLAVIYVHGMGDQTRLCDPTTLLNSLETYWRKVDSTYTFTPVVQTHPSTPSDPHHSLNVTLPNGSTLDVHEVYWAPKAPNVAATTVLSWMRKQLVVPFLRRHSRWAELSRLKLGVLGQGVTTRHMTPQDSHTLRAQYEHFAQQKPHGSFFEYARAAPTPPQPAADRWQKLTKSNDLSAIWVVLSMILATLVFALFVTEAVVGLAQFFQQEPLAKWAARYGLSYSNVVDGWYIYPLIAMSVIVTLAWAFGIRPFFSKFMGDVVQWATYQETEEGFKVRRAILDRSSDVFRDVLRIPKSAGQPHEKPQYDRVIVIAHSLGSVIAHDTLLALKRDHPGSLEQISDFITYGSPIDKFAYFFEALQGQSPRYIKTIQQLRGQLFEDRIKPLVWQNFYEEGDPIGGTIHTVGPSWDLPQMPLPSRIHNIYTANANVALVAPNHTGYIHNKLVIFRVWNALMPNTFPDRAAQPQERTDVDVMAHTRWMRQMYAVILLIPWVLLASYVAHAAHLIQLQVHLNSSDGTSPALWWLLWAGLGLSAALLLISFLKPVHLLKPLAIALTALTLVGNYAAYTSPKIWADVPAVKNTTANDAPPPQQQTCKSAFSGTTQNFTLNSTCQTPKPPQYPPAKASWANEAPDVFSWSSALVGLIVPALLAAALLLVTKARSMRHGTKLEAQTHERPNTLLPWIIGMLIGFIAVSSAASASGQAILPWWWWRTTLIYATFSLIIVGLVQLVWPKRKLRHLLNP
ncbi:alpha/beta hydrolase family protein [Deinococcus aquaedulcis]|uniref:hypothetical protein n=1 Tax=Deinococcus aquaedulcis TaxID=2840455 RepID=UPI001C83D312|nr:hypothetical protein [Deinococcus aquaedulcis]